MLMCKAATRLMSERLDRPLDWRERLSLKAHLAMCGPCTQCNRQFGLMHQAGKRFNTDVPDDQKPGK